MYFERPMKNTPSPFAAFCMQYERAWSDDGYPTQTDVQEVFVDAVCNEPPTKLQLIALHRFFRAQLKNTQIPLTWYCNTVWSILQKKRSLEEAKDRLMRCLQDMEETRNSLRRMFGSD
jgi:hypothetical protein